MFTGWDTGSLVVKADIAHVYRQRYRQFDGKRWHCTCLQAEIQEVSDQMRQLMKDINAINQQGCGVSAEVGNLRREIQGWYGNKCRFHCWGYFLMMFKWAYGESHVWLIVWNVNCMHSKSSIPKTNLVPCCSGSLWLKKTLVSNFLCVLLNI